MKRKPNDEQEAIHGKVFPYREQIYYNGRNNYEFQNLPSPYHWNLPKPDKSLQDDCNHNDSKNQLSF